MNQATIAIWVSIAALVMAAVSAIFTGADFLAGHRERKRKALSERPSIMGYISPDDYGEGWRLAQLHIQPPEELQRDYPYQKWRIERAVLLRPKDAFLARPVDANCVSNGPCREQQLRELDGRSAGQPQTFALEFFIKFAEPDRLNGATFKVTFSHLKRGQRRTVKVSPRVGSSTVSA